MRTAIELHDSKLVAINIRNDQIALEFRPAYIHESSGIPGVDPGRGGWQNVDVVVDGHTASLPVVDFPVNVSHGRLVIDDESWSNVIPFPLDQGGAVALDLVLASAQTVTLRGRRIAVEATGEADCGEQFVGRTRRGD